MQAQPDRVLGYVQNQSLVSGPLSALVEVYEHITVTGTQSTTLTRVALANA